MAIRPCPSVSLAGNGIRLTDMVCPRLAHALARAAKITRQPCFIDTGPQLPQRVWHSSTRHCALTMLIRNVNLTEQLERFVMAAGGTPLARSPKDSAPR